MARLLPLLALLLCLPSTGSASGAACEEGVAKSGGFAFSCNNVELLAWETLVGIPTLASDIWGWTDPTTGTPYAILGLFDGVAFIELADPTHPVLLGTLPSASGTSAWADIKVYRDHAYVVKDNAGNHGVQVFDLRQLRAVASPPVEFAATAHYTQVSNVHNLVIDEASGFLYAVGSTLGATGVETCGGGLHAIDLATPASPRFAGCFAADGYTHDAQCVTYAGPDLEHRGSEVCFNANSGPGGAERSTGGQPVARHEDGEGGRLTLVDVSDKTAPRLLAVADYPEAAFAHQGWLTEDQRYFLMGDEADELDFGIPARTLVWDVSDLDAPHLVGDHRSQLTSTDHNLYVVGEHVFQANYSSGLRILHLADLASARLEEVAWFDTYPPHDGVGTGLGAWSVYPFFEEDFVVVSDILLGLFVLRPTLEPTPREIRIALRRRLHPQSQGLLRVTLLSDPAFDPAQVDPQSLAFGPAGAPLAHDLSDPRRFSQHLVRRSGDGPTDLVAHFRTPETGIEGGQRQVCLLGRTTLGEPFKGCTEITTVSDGDRP